ncbi:MAG: hypothetical protein AAB914_03300 [Patescibacteria group bacterium]
MSGCGYDKISDDQKPITIPPSTKDLGPDVLNNKYGDQVISGRSFQVPTDLANDVVCPELVWEHIESGNNLAYTVYPVRKVDIFPTDSSKLIIRCLYDKESRITRDIPVEITGAE